ncbi:hypothetical protein N431DRAFT_484589 [Stipitochalara longipes BDJ]|nr:hypothetical protein N431DRAFT_484589 [Stipitochalara longipes BDJ]
MASNTNKSSFFNITDPGMLLVLWDITFGIPLAFILTYLNKYIFRALGYETFMRSPGGARLNQAIFLLVNIWLIVGWGRQLMEEAKLQREMNVRRLKEEIKYWDAEISRLEGLVEEKQVEEQLLGGQKREGEREEAARVVVVDGEIRLAKLGSPFKMRRQGLGAANQGLREPSPPYRSRF